MAVTGGVSYPSAPPERRLTWAGCLLGFALGGFFDGILLHQILQWHHLLSAVQGATFQDVRVQVLADGIFHLGMYAIALAGLLVLWQGRRALAQLNGTRLWADVFIGFGLWHVLDGVFSHWVFGIHRIRMDSANPLAWDLLWFFAFGVVFLAIGLYMRRAGRFGTGGHRRATGAASIVSVLALASGHWAALPPPEVTTVIVLLGPNATANDLIDGLATIRGGIVWADVSGKIWVVDVRSSSNFRTLYSHGALIISSSPAALGCLAFARVLNT